MELPKGRNRFGKFKRIGKMKTKYMVVVSHPRWKWKLPLTRHKSKKMAQVRAKLERKRGFNAVIKKYTKTAWIKGRGD